MREREEAPTIVIAREPGQGVGSFVIGALLGAGIALLLAPRTGKETQEEIRTRALQLKDAAEERVRDASRQLEARLDEAREGLHARADRVREAVDSGRKAATDARHELEEKLERSKAAYRAGIEAARATVAEGDESDDETSD
ncbi:MAG TPA: YtxH domain-containing protein [Longimicrobiales bacterium]|nr:YtxH domain-containing protein [Longimicrobiales bacterium]